MLYEFELFAGLSFFTVSICDLFDTLCFSWELLKFMLEFFFPLKCLKYGEQITVSFLVYLV